MSSNNHDALLRQAAEAMRAGNKEEALKLVVQVLEDDENNVKALTLAYRLVDDPQEKVELLEKILEVDPGNTRVQEALNKLTGGRKRPVADDEEVAPGISRRQLMLFGGGALGFILILVLMASLVISNANRSRQGEFATQTAFVLGPTQTNIIMVATQVEGTIQAQGTFDAQSTLTTHTPTPSNTPISATLPPEFTNTPTPTQIVSPTPLPPPSGASGTIIGFGGDNLLNDGNADIWAFPVNQPGTVNRLNQSYRGLYPSGISPEHFVFSAFRTDSFEHALYLVDAEARDFLSAQWLGATENPRSTTQPFMSADGTKIVFVGTDQTNFKQLYLYDASLPVGPERLKRLTNDQNNYSFPALSPDGLRVIAGMETGVQPQVLHDLVFIDLETLAITALTADGPVTTESQPRFSPDGNIVAYVVEVPNAESGETNHDIYLRTADGFGDAIQVTGDGGGVDNIHPVYSPNGNYLAFSSNRRGTYNIFTYDLTTGLLNQITDSPSNDYYPGAWVE